MGRYNVPGVVIDHIPAETQRYIGSPSLAVLPDGTYVASHDVFGERSTYDTTRVFRSKDRGDSWTNLCDIKGQFWSGLFTHKDVLYLMGTTRQYGSVSVRKSEDGGITWSAPENDKTGLLLRDGMYHTAPMPVIVLSSLTPKGGKNAMAALEAGARYAVARGAVEFESTDSAKDKALYIYRLMVHDKVLQPLPEDQVAVKSIKHKLAIWYSKQLPKDHPLLK